jgi:toxin-antitoxin system PIN domain toxin
MIVPDANLLIYAYDRGSQFHDKAKHWWHECLSGTETVALTHAVVFAFVRVGTNSHAFTDPLTLGEATDYVTSWLHRSIVQVIQPGANHIREVFDLLAAAGSAGGNLVVDAQVAALALSRRAVVHTADQDFRRFPGVKCHYPLG